MKSTQPKQSSSPDQPGYAVKLQNQRQANIEQQLIRYEECMFRRWGRHLVLILVLKYRRDVREETTYETVREDRLKLLRSFRLREELAGIKGYAWKAEQGYAGGDYHLHLLVFFDGNHRKGRYFARVIGEFWVREVTEGRGSYSNSNLAADLAAPGTLHWGNVTGQIDRHDTDKRERLRNYMTTYFGKQTQPIADRGSRQHSFATGRLPPEAERPEEQGI